MYSYLYKKKRGKELGPLKNIRPTNIITKNYQKTIANHYINSDQRKNWTSSFSQPKLPNRSATDVAWNHKWFAAKTQKENTHEIFITWIDFSSLRARLSSCPVVKDNQISCGTTRKKSGCPADNLIFGIKWYKCNTILILKSN